MTEETLTQAGLDSSSAKVFPRGTLCIALYGATVGKVGILDVDAATNQAVCGIFLPKDVDTQYLFYFLLSKRRALIEQGKGGAQSNISNAIVREMVVPLAPLPEQRRIVAKIEELFSDLDAGVAALERVRANLKRYRAAVLKAAVEGRLTEEWRKQNPVAPEDTTAKLLERILLGRRAKWEQDQLRKFEETGKTPPKGWKEKYKPPPSQNAPEMHELLPSWCWATVEQLGDPGEQPVLTGPFGSTLGREDFIESGVPLLTIGCLSEGGIKLDKAFYISEEKAAQLERYRVRAGDLLFSRSASVGRAGFVTDALAGSVVNYHLMRLRLGPDAINPQFFISYVRGASAVYRYLRRVNHGATRDGINTDDLLAMPVALPPFAEQSAIVAEVDRRLSVADAAEQQVEHALQRAARLRQAILKRAFEGKLVPQEAPQAVMPAAVDQEPASAYLFKPEPEQTLAPAARSGGINFRRGAVASYVIQALSGSPHFGRTQLEKVLHITQTHLGIDIGLEFQRHAAGPFDKAIFGLESLARKRGWFTTTPRAKFGVKYAAGPKVQDRLGAAATILGNRRAELDTILRFVRRMDTDQAELFSTVYAAWNDLLIDGRPGDDAAIVAEVHGWHESKRRFTPERIEACIRWLRTASIVPQGTGKRTQPLAKDAIAPSPKSPKRRSRARA